MQRALPLGMIFGFVICHAGEILKASEADEIREQVQAMRKKATVIAEKAKEEVTRLREAAERMELKAREQDRRPDAGHENEKGRLKERLEALRSRYQELRESHGAANEQGEIREQIAKIERELRTPTEAGPFGSRPVPAELRPQLEKLEKASQRIRHMRVAAENLKQAELHDLAHELMEKAELMEREVHEARQQMAEEFRKSPLRGPEPDQVRDLKGEIERLRARVKELSQQLEAR